MVDEKKEKPEIISEEDEASPINQTKIFKRYKIQEVISKANTSCSSCKRRKRK